MFKKFLIPILYFFTTIFSITIIITLLNYFNIFNTNIINTLKFITPLIAIIISGFTIGKNSKQKGYIEGLKLGIIIIIILLIINITIDKFNYKSLILYIILIFTSTLSSMIGINKKKVN